MTAMTLIGAGFLAGLLGSVHCIGMCSPLAMLLERAGTGHARLQFICHAGRLATYMMLGVLAGGAGQVLEAAGGWLVLRMLAALLVLLLGVQLLTGLSLLRPLEQAGSRLWQWVMPHARGILPVTSAPRAFGAGVLWGLVPCGLVYSAVALGGSSGQPLTSAAVMLAFWLATVPAVWLGGALARRAGGQGRAPVRRFAALALIAAGAIGLWQPLAQVHGSGHAHHTHLATGTPDLRDDTAESDTPARSHHSEAAGT